MIKLSVNFQKFLPLIISLPLILLSACSATTDPAVMFKNQSAEQIYQGGERALAKREYSSAVQHFEGLDTLYPFSDNSEQAQLDLIYAYYKTYDMASTAATAERFIRLYPRSQYVDYAYYMKGVADFEQDRGWLQRVFPVDLSDRDPGTTVQAFTDFQQLLQFFPNSPYAPDARQRMIYLRNLFAKHELFVAQYYLRRGANVAAINRANYILQHYDATPSVQEALGVMVQAYRKLGMQEEADQTLQVLALNYPHGKVIEDLLKNSKTSAKA